MIKIYLLFYITLNYFELGPVKIKRVFLVFCLCGIKCLSEHIFERRLNKTFIELYIYFRHKYYILVRDITVLLNVFLQDRTVQAPGEISNIIYYIFYNRINQRHIYRKIESERYEALTSEICRHLFIQIYVEFLPRLRH